jgi:predicted ester cyclase
VGDRRLGGRAHPTSHPPEHPGLENLHTTIEQIVAAGDEVVAVQATTGTWNGRTVTYREISNYRLVDGKIVENWYAWDRLGFFQQIGVLPETSDLMCQARLWT